MAEMSAQSRLRDRAQCGSLSLPGLGASGFQLASADQNAGVSVFVYSIKNAYYLDMLLARLTIPTGMLSLIAKACCFRQRATRSRWNTQCLVVTQLPQTSAPASSPDNPSRLE